MKKLLLDHVCQYHPAVDSIVEENVKYRAFYQEVMERTVALVVQWQAKGFVHGVLNTDNMSLLGLTIDYGPYGFVEHFDKDFVPNGSDGTARYSYQRQEEICKWNLQKLSEILDPVLPARESSTILQQYTELFRKLYVDAFRSKFGITFEVTFSIFLLQVH